VEALLNQAADLLDRCLLERARYESLLSQAASLDFALRAEEETSLIDNQKLREGFLHFAREDAELRSDRLAGMQQFVDQAHNELVAVDEHNQEEAVHASSADKSRAKAEIQLHEITRKRHNLEKELADREIVRVNHFGANEQIRVEEELERMQIELLSASTKLLADKKESRLKDGALAFQSQAERSLDHVVRDYVDAADRLVVAAEGLRLIYGYCEESEISRPWTTASIDAFAENFKRVVAGSPAALDDAVAWVRGAIRFLAAFSQNDQTVTVTVSLQRSAAAVFSTLLKGKPVSFPMARELFTDYTYVRLRGLSASLRLKTAAPFPVRCVVTLPSDAEFIITDDEGGEKTKPVQQGTMPACTLGRVIDSRIPVAPEVCGQISLMNASPIGRKDGANNWGIRMDFITNDKASEVEDVLLDVRVSVRPRQREE